MKIDPKNLKSFVKECRIYCALQAETGNFSKLGVAKLKLIHKKILSPLKEIKFGTKA